MAAEGTAGDRDVLEHINDLANEEHELFEKESRGEASAADKDHRDPLPLGLSDDAGGLA